jgi:hypothetical protein
LDLSFHYRIIDLVGTTYTDLDAIATWLKDGVKDVTNRIIEADPEKAPLFSDTKTLATDMISTPIPSVQVLSVVREDGTEGRYRPAEMIHPSLRYLATDNTSLQYRTKQNPAWYMLDGKIYVIPEPEDAGNRAQVSYVDYAENESSPNDGTELDSSSRGIKNFPDGYEHLVVLYAAMKTLHSIMTQKSNEIEAPTLLAAPISMSDAVIEFDSISAKVAEVHDIRNAPTALALVPFTSYTNTVGPLDLQAELPDLPEDLSAAFIAPISTAPSYNIDEGNVLDVTPFVNFFAGYDPLTISVNLPAPLTAPVFTNPSPELQNAVGDAEATFEADPPDYIPPAEVVFENFSLNSVFAANDPGIFTLSAGPPDTIEDSIDSFDSYLGDDGSNTGGVFWTAMGVIKDLVHGNATGWGSEEGDMTALERLSDDDLEMLSGTLQTVQTESQRAQLALDEALKGFQSDISAFQASYGKYSAEAQAYATEVQAEVSEYKSNLEKFSMELQTSYGIWKDNQVNKITKYRSQQQDALGQFNAQNAEYQANLQLGIQTMQSQISAEVAKMNTSTQADVQAGAQLLQKESGEYQQAVAKYRAELDQYQSAVNTQVQEHQVNLQKELQVWQSEQEQELRRYQLIQSDALNAFNAGMAEYQSNLQVALQNAKFEDNFDTKKIQIYQEELNTYQASVNTQVTEHQSNIKSAIETWSQEQQQEIARYQAGLNSALQEYQSDARITLQNANAEQTVEIQKAVKDMEASVSEYNLNLQKYSAEVQKVSAHASMHIQRWATQIQSLSINYQWLQDQYNRLQFEYEQFFAVMAGRSLGQKEGKREAS